MGHAKAECSCSEGRDTHGRPLEVDQHSCSYVAAINRLADEAEAHADIRVPEALAIIDRHNAYQVHALMDAGTRWNRIYHARMEEMTLARGLRTPVRKTNGVH